MKIIGPYPFDTDVWVSFSLKVSTSAPVTSEWMVVGQFRATDDPSDYGARSPVFAQEITPGGGFRVVTRSDPTDPSAGNSLAVERFVEPSFQFGVWRNYVYKLRFSRTGLGSIQAWRDGVEIIAMAAVPVGMNDAEGPHWKYGIYRAPAAETVVSEWANVEVATISLASRVTSPLPVPA